MSIASPVIEHLRDALQSDGCVLYAGNGIAINAGAPSFPQFASRLLREHGFRGPLDTDYEAVADLIRMAIPKAAFESSARKSFGPTDGLTPTLTALGELPFVSAVTTMWPNLLERTFAGRAPYPTWPTTRAADAPTEAEANRDMMIAHLFGFAAAPSSLLCSWGEYDDAIYSDPGFDRDLRAETSSKTWLFVGASVDTVRFVVRRMRLRRELHGVDQHVAVFPEGGATSTDVALLETYGVTSVISSSNQVAPFLRSLSLPREPRRSRVPARKVVVDGLYLENIGGFRERFIPFRNPNVLLVGDNATGKSTALRALAVALSGTNEEPSEAGAALLRNDSDRGMIRVSCGGRNYESHLFRTGNGVGVESSRPTPVQTGELVALGFSIPRGVFTRGVAGPSPILDYQATAADLRPLASGTIDTRIDDVAQWIVNAAVRRHQPDDPLLLRYFDLLSSLSPGMRVELDSIDAASWDVVVKTADGRLRLQQLSSGMLAVMGWVGVVLERLFRAFPDTRAPEQQPCLVIVDEIDVHLHPAWQRQILPMLSKTFPKAQFIVSTHSPLVVGSADDRCSVIQLSHGGPAGLSVSEIIGPFQQWRSDQILTGPAFDLDSTRSSVMETTLDVFSTDFANAHKRGDDEAMRALSEYIAELLPSPAETPAERHAESIVRKLLEQQIALASSEDRHRVAAEAAKYLEHIRAGQKP